MTTNKLNTGPRLFTDSLIPEVIKTTEFSLPELKAAVQQLQEAKPLTDTKIKMLVDIYQKGALKPEVIVTILACAAASDSIADVDVWLSLLMIMYDESAFDASAVNAQTQARGLMQLLPSSVDFGEEYARKKFSVHEWIVAMGPVITLLAPGDPTAAKGFSLMRNDLPYPYTDVLPTAGVYAYVRDQISTMFKFTDRWTYIGGKRLRKVMQDAMSEPYLLPIWHDYAVGLHFLVYNMWLHGKGGIIPTASEFEKGEKPLVYFNVVPKTHEQVTKQNSLPVFSALAYMDLRTNPEWFNKLFNLFRTFV